MTTTMQRRVEALEGPGGRACPSCELAALGRSATTTTEFKPLDCTHWPRRTLAEELFDLDAVLRTTP